MHSTQANFSQVLPVENWSDKYIGLPWRKGARGPDAFDCWGFLWYVYLKERNIKLSLYGHIDATNNTEVKRAIDIESGGGFGSVWERVDKPFEFCGVVMQQAKFFHVGTYTEQDGGFIVHASLYENVVAVKPSKLLRTRFSRISYYGLSR